jgi:hypothetical protein
LSFNLSRFGIYIGISRQLWVSGVHNTGPQ